MLAGSQLQGEIKSKEAVCIIGGGWYGTHLALCLSPFYLVTLLEKNSRPFSDISGAFGIRLHTGPHYPRSSETRENCRKGGIAFKEYYPELVNDHSHSIYAYGQKDAQGKPPKVDAESFKAICHESGNCTEIPPEDLGYAGIDFAMDIPQESSLVLGSRLRDTITGKLRSANVTTRYNFRVTRITKRDDGKFNVFGSQSDGDDFIDLPTTLVFSHLINATSFKFNIPSSLPCNLKFVYQVCLALIYQINEPQEKPFSFIVMDGWFPCLMPCDVRSKTDTRIDKYIVTHGKYTNLMTSDNLQKAEEFLRNDVPSLIELVKIACEEEMTRFWPAFLTLFQYCGFKAVVLAKPVAEGEFRSAITFKDGSDMIHVFPGKVSDVFIVQDEVKTLLENDLSLITTDGEFKYVTNGVIDTARAELAEPLSGDRNTSSLQSHYELRTTPIISDNHSTVFSSLSRDGLALSPENITKI